MLTGGASCARLLLLGYSGARLRALVVGESESISVALSLAHTHSQW